MTEQGRAAAILRAEQGIIAEHNGSRHHVDGRYYANPSDADRQRRWLAEKRVREEERLEGICGWCNHVFDESDKRIPAAGRFICAGKCTDEFNALCFSVGGVEIPPDELRAIAEWSNGPTDSELDAAFDGIRVVHFDIGALAAHAQQEGAP